MPQTPVPALDEVTSASAQELSALLARGALRVEQVVESCLTRIADLDRQGPALRAVIEVNPDALDIASERDRERAAGKPPGALHGLPVLLKDNIDTADRMLTSAGSLLLTSAAPRDAFLVERLRNAGAVLLGKTNLSEWANFRSSHGTSGWSARGGLTRNPHVLDRSASGSSSGTAAAIAAGFAPLGVGTETDGSILSPAGACGIVGLKPTLGLWSRSGIIPIAASQDTAGPMGRSVADVARLLGALVGADPRDAASTLSEGHFERDYTRHLDIDGLVGARLGVPRNLAGFHPDVDRLLERAIELLSAAGAVVVDALELPGAGKFDDAELEVLLHEFKAGMSSYLSSRPGAGMPTSLADLIAGNQREQAAEMPWFGQDLFERAQLKPSLSDPGYKAARAHCLEQARTLGLDALLQRHRLQALIHPTNAPAWTVDLLNGNHILGGNASFAAVAGYPSISVPMGATRGLPVGLSFTGPAWSEAALLRIAYAFEQHSQARIEPRFLPTLPVC